MLLGPAIPKSGPVFNFEETKDLPVASTDAFSQDFNSFDYDPLIGLVPYRDFDPETGEIYEHYDDQDED